MVTLHEVSPSFKAISTEIAVKAFDIARDIRNDDAAFLKTIREIFTYLSLLGTRFRHPSEWGNTSVQTIDCSASSYVFAHALYLSCASLRRNAIRSPRDGYETTHNVILAALDQAEALCDRVRPSEMTYLLRKSMCQERELAVVGLKVVQGFGDLMYYTDALVLFQSHVENDGTGPVAGARSLIHSSLRKVDGLYEAYEGILDKKSSSLEPHVYELPGVFQCLRKVATLTINEDQFFIRERIKQLVDHWSIACPFLDKAARPRGELAISGVVS